MLSTLANNKTKILKLKKMLIIFFGDCPTFIFDQKSFIIFFLCMISLYKLHSHIHYEEFY